MNFELIAELKSHLSEIEGINNLTPWEILIITGLRIGANGDSRNPLSDNEARSFYLGVLEAFESNPTAQDKKLFFN